MATSDGSSVIRLAEAGEMPLMAEIIRDAFLPIALEMGITRDEHPTYNAYAGHEYLAQYVAAHRITMYLVSVGDRAVGCGGCSPDPDDLRRGWLNRIAMRPEVQGKGYGRRLIGFLEDRLRQAGMTRVRLGHVSANEPLHEFYRRLGYETVSRHDSDAWKMEITYMEKAL